MKTKSPAPYFISLIFNRKKYEVYIKINKEKDQTGYHYDLEFAVNGRISGNEFTKFKKYLEDEGYIDSAIEYYENN